MQDLQKPHVQPLQEDLRQMSGNMLHATHGSKNSHEESAAVCPPLMLDLQGNLVLDTQIMRNFVIHL
jgi:hypothetical protein